MPAENKHYTIPLFIPMQGCPFDCVFCNQRNITGQHNTPTDAEIAEKIENHLLTIPKEIKQIEIGFFGGNFTGLPVGLQKHYLSLIQPWIKKGQISGIRLSTRPDYINAETLEILKQNNVKAIEIGVQSMDNEVLKLSGRGHKVEDSHKAAALIKAHGFSLGLQMMIGLPGDSFNKSLKTAQAIVSMGADSTRIYPTLVVRNTNLETRYLNGSYKPLSLDEAIEWCSRIVPLFEQANIKILRLGLHPSEGLLNGNDLIAGPFHVAFGELVYSKIWQKCFMKIQSNTLSSITVYVNPSKINQAVGHKGINKSMLEEKFKKVRFMTNKNLAGRLFYVDYH